MWCYCTAVGNYKKIHARLSQLTDREIIIRFNLRLLKVIRFSLKLQALATSRPATPKTGYNKAGLAKACHSARYRLHPSRFIPSKQAAIKAGTLLAGHSSPILLLRRHIPRQTVFCVRPSPGRPIIAGSISV